MRPVRRVQFRH